MRAAIETEIKLRVESARSSRALLRRHGFKTTARRIFEQNLILDDGRGSLRKRGVLLRLRAAGTVVTCTFKGPEIAGRHKRRDELEFRASDFKTAVAIFAALGFREAFRYEKYRTEFARDNEPGHVTLDETPIGIFMELEGPARWIDRTAKALGYSQENYITESYGKLYEDWCRARGVEPRNMLFKARQ